FTLTDTLGNRSIFNDFDSSIAAGQKGQIKKYINAAGDETTYQYASGLLSTIQRYRGTAASGTRVERLTYTPSLQTGLTDRVGSVLMARIFGASLQKVRDVL